MTLTVTLEWWLVLPVLLTVVLVAGGLWVDIPSWQDVEGLIFAVAVSVFAWGAVIYGRYERWLVLPVVITLFCIGLTWWERKDIKREGVRFTATVGIICWGLVLWGRLTA